MQTIRLIAGEQEYYLGSRQELDAARTAAVDAIQAGGGFVDLVDVSGREIGILVSTGVQLRFELTQLPDAVSTQPTPRTIAYDFDY